MPELPLVVMALAAAAVAVLAPLARRADAPPDDRADAEAARIRYRVALEALRDVEADHRSGAPDDATYALEREGAEARAAEALHELEAREESPAAPSREPPRWGRRLALVAAAVIGLALVVGSVLPAPVGLATQTVVDEGLAASRAAEAARQERIAELRERLEDDLRDTEALSALADELLAGGSADDLAHAAAALILLLDLEPHDESAYRRLISAYMRAGDYDNASAALDSFAVLDPDPADLAFFRGLLALRDEDDPDVAVRQFDRFLELAPDDERAPMVRALRADAARQLDR
jgi:tetratricopeptide (TPR) repeat protein